MDELFIIIMQNTLTDEIESNHIFLNRLEAKQLIRKIDEIVYTTYQDGKEYEWKLISIKPTKK